MAKSKEKNMPNYGNSCKKIGFTNKSRKSSP